MNSTVFFPNLFVPPVIAIVTQNWAEFFADLRRPMQTYADLGRPLCRPGLTSCGPVQTYADLSRPLCRPMHTWADLFVDQCRPTQTSVFKQEISFPNSRDRSR